jgi:hypothetical protein
MQYVRFYEKHKTHHLDRTLPSLLPWQQELLDETRQEPDGRSIIWYYDKNGDIGKSKFSAHVKSISPTEYYSVNVIGSMRDFARTVKHALDKCTNFRCILFNLNRSCEEHKSIYSPLEMMADGTVTSVKYDSETLDFNPVHVIVFANFMPDVNKLSLDRWKIRVAGRTLTKFTGDIIIHKLDQRDINAYSKLLNDHKNSTLLSNISEPPSASIDKLFLANLAEQGFHPNYDI